MTTRKPRSSPLQRILSGCTIFLSAFLLFAIEPLTAKRILPWFGGSAAVWSTCLVFYQSALLLGYGYALVVTRYCRPWLGALIHIGLLVCALLYLPIGPHVPPSGATGQTPAVAILALLATAIGLPFLVLSATSPLLQHWMAKTDSNPYRLFALSNAASLLALLSYPLLVEPLLDTTAQAAVWSRLFAIFAVLCAVLAYRQRRPAEIPAFVGERIYLLPDRLLTWFALSSCGSMLLLSVTNHIEENVAAVPLLWVLPLALYLLTFILAFGAGRSLPRAIWLRLLAFALGILGYSIYDINSVEPVQISIPILLTGLFVCCMFCHGELNHLRPDASNITTFYLVVAAGGAAGALLVGLVAPVVFDAVYELPVTLVVTALLALALTWNGANLPLRLLWIGVTLCTVAVVGANVLGQQKNAIAMTRDFYAALRVLQSPHAGPNQTRTLLNGTIEHGSQYLLLPNRKHPTTYYGPDSGVGILLREGFAQPTRVGVVGLGAGTLAAYGRAGDTYRFYELNDQVTAIARNLFTYLRESRAAIEVVSGDARLSLDHDKGKPPLDVLVLDAFSGDAIPVHLLTAEAMRVYWQRLKPDGVLAVHVSNNFLDLGPVVERMGQSVGWSSILIRSHENAEEDLTAADWVLVTSNASVLSNPSLRVHAFPIDARPELRIWTDSYNNLFQVLKLPQVR